MANIYKEFLEFVEIDEKDIETLLPRWIEGAKVLRLTETDIEHAMKEYIPQNWEIQYLGVRKMLGSFVRELIETASLHKYKEEGVKLVYGIIPAISINYQGLKYAGGDKVYTGFPDIQLVSTINGLFHNLDWYLERAEEDGMTYGCRHCALNKTRIGAKASGVIPSPDVIWSWGLNCDEGPKTDEYISLMYNEDWRYVVSRIPHDTNFGYEDDEDEERVEYLAEVLKSGQNEIEDIIGIKASPADMKRAIADQARYTFKFSQLNSLVVKSNPQVLSGSALSYFGHPFNYPWNSGQKYMEEALDIMIREVREAIKKGEGTYPKDAPKLGHYFVPYAVPWIDRMFKENGVGVTFSLTFVPSKSQLKPAKYEDPFMATAEVWLKFPFGQNMGYEIEGMIEKVEDSKPFDGLIMGFFDFDRWLGAHHKIASKIIEERTGIPTFYIEADFWEDRDYSPEALRTRIESIAQVVKMRKQQGYKY